MSASRDGRKIAFVDRNARTTIYRARIDPARGVLTSAPEPVLSGSIEVYDAGLAPDGESLVLASTDPPQQLFVMRTDGSGFRQITDGPYRSRQAAWSPDGKSLVFQSSRFPGGLAYLNADGGGLRELIHGQQSAAEPTFSSDGRRVAFGGSSGAYFLELSPSLEAGAMREIPFPQKETLYAPSSFSPDDRLLAGTVRQHGAEVGVALYSIPDERWTFIDIKGVRRPKLLGNDGRMVLDLGTAIVALDGSKATPRTLVRAAAGHSFRNLSLSLDRRTISWIDQTDESDIWLMSFEAPGK
jgi:Tol biopolymer transport system component